MVPTISYAAVKVSEVAWMGTSVSASDEWIELHNDSANAVSLDGWSLRDGANLNIALSGTLAGNAYGVLERTDDDTLPGKAFLIYSGSLTNAGTTLTLYDAAGSVEDQVIGGENWKNIGGDNVTKDTAQRTDNGWVTAPATPGSALSNYVPTANGNDTSTDAGRYTSSSNVEIVNSEKRIEMHVPDDVLHLEIHAPDIAYVDEPVVFAAVPSGLAPTMMDSLHYEWNFGDLSIASGTRAVHTYEHAGEYVATLYGSYTHYDQTVQKTITVLPVALSLSTNDQGEVLIHNNAKYEVDISNYTLVGVTTIQFPPRSIMLPEATITLAKDRFPRRDLGELVLYDPRGAVSAQLYTSPTQQAVQGTPLTQTNSAYLPAVSKQTTKQDIADEAQNSNFSFTGAVALRSTGGQPAPADQSASVKNEESSSSSSQNQAAVINAGSKIPKKLLPYFGLFGVVAVGLLAVFATRI